MFSLGTGLIYVCHGRLSLNCLHSPPLPQSAARLMTVLRFDGITLPIFLLESKLLERAKVELKKDENIEIKTLQTVEAKCDKVSDFFF